MPSAYVLINCDIGSEQDIINELKSIPNVTETHGTFGAYDIITKVESKSTDNLREIITWKIRKMEHIRSTLTMMTIEGQE